MLRILVILSILANTYVPALAHDNEPISSNVLQIELPITEALGWDLSKQVEHSTFRQGKHLISLDFGWPAPTPSKNAGWMPQRTGWDGMLISN
jgi:hypothetical protein